jgi:hypothetical protein
VYLRAPEQPVSGRLQPLHANVGQGLSVAAYLPTASHAERLLRQSIIAEEILRRDEEACDPLATPIFASREKKPARSLKARAARFLI